jgi:integrase/recombinase XerC
MHEAMKEFIQYLESQDLSDLTVKGYSSDIKHFVHWFSESNGETQGLESITPTDRKEYKKYLLVV